VSLPPPLALRLARVVRLAAHLVRGLVTVRSFRNRDPHHQDRVAQRWSRRLLAILNVRLRVHNAPANGAPGTLIVANHVSWLDIFALYAAVPGVFVAKSEIARWPVLGDLVARAGTIFIERGRGRHASRTNERIVAALTSGRRVVVFPEGTTTDGSKVKRFHAALLQPAINANALVQPVALRYTDGRGARSDAAVYVGDTSLVESLRRILSARRLEVELCFEPAIAPGEHDRRSLAQSAHAAITRALEPAPSDNAPETGADPRAAGPTASHPTRTPYPARSGWGRP